MTSGPASAQQGQQQKPNILVVMADDIGYAAAHSSKQQRSNSCRARYSRCLKLQQIFSFECQYIYEDCIKHIY
jgi:hypothetical protein